MSKIYTKTGDDGYTYNGEHRVPKYDCSIDGQGEIDELNAWIGTIKGSFLDSSLVATHLVAVQNNLFMIGAQLATQKKYLKFEEISSIENLIDEMDAKLPKLKNFVFPAGDIHIARAVCRRAERVILEWMHKSEKTDRFDFVVEYLNRLSDYLFVLARFIDHYVNARVDEIWKVG